MHYFCQWLENINNNIRWNLVYADHNTPAMKLIPTGGVFMNIVEQIVAVALISTVLVIRREYKRKKDRQAYAKNKSKSNK